MGSTAGSGCRQRGERRRRGLWAPRVPLVSRLALLFWLPALACLAQEGGLERPLLPACPDVQAQGCSFTANAGGYSALFYNPAAFAGQKGSLTFYSASASLYANPVRLVGQLFSPDPAGWAAMIEDEITGGGVGFNVSDGIGYVGKGIGVGAVVDTDMYLYGSTALGAEGQLYVTVAYIGGAAFPLQLGGAQGATLSLGMDLRPMIRLAVPVNNDVVIDILDAIFAGGNPLATLNSADARYGYAMALDVGAILEMGRLKLGLALRDLGGTDFHYTESVFGDILVSIRDQGKLPVGGTELSGYSIPATMSVGVAYDLGFPALEGKFEPVLHASLDDLVSTVLEGRSLFSLLHVGAEVRLFRFLTLWTGLNQGYLTLGGGLHLFVVDLNFALFTREMGEYLGDRPSSGMSLELAFRL